jgi:type IV pilus assembly protein PilO
MALSVEEILEAPTQTKVLSGLGIYALVLAVAWFFLVKPTQDEAEKISLSLNGAKGLRTRVIELDKIVKNLPAYRDEVEKLDVELKKVLAELPDKREISELLSRISDKARDSGLEIRIFKPQAEIKREFYAEVPVELEVRGNFHQVATFFDEVGHLERIVNIDTFSLLDPMREEKKIYLTTTAIATSFRFLDESERPKVDEDGKTSGKSKKKAKNKKE